MTAKPAAAHCTQLLLNESFTPDPEAMDHSFTAELWYWRGPSPFYFLTVPADLGREIATIAPDVSYGWGMIPATIRVGKTEWTTSLFPKDGGYVVPVKVDVRRAEQLEDGEDVTVQLIIDD